GYSTIGDAINSPEGRVENSEQFIGNLTRIIGRHTLKTGATIWPVQLNRVFLSGIQRGSFNFTNIWVGGSTGLPEFLLGLPQTADRNIGLVRVDGRSVFYNFYGSDDIRVNRRLTLSLGLRYELRPSFVDKENRLSTFIQEGNGRFAVAGDPNNGFNGRMNRALYRTPKKNFAPRAALALDLTGDGKTVLRMGYGIFYNMEIFNSQVLNALNPPFVISQTFQASPAAGIVLRISDPFSTTDPRAGGLPGGLGITPWFRQGYMQQWSFGIQRQLGAQMGLDVSYVGNKGTALDGVRVVNQGGLRGAGAAAYLRPFQDFGTFITADSFGDSIYHSLQTRLTRRFSSGLTFIAGYTYGHAIDNSPGEGNGSGGNFFVMDNNDVRRERGNADFDVRHRHAELGLRSPVWAGPPSRGRRTWFHGQAPGRLASGGNLPGADRISDKRDAERQPVGHLRVPGTRRPSLRRQSARRREDAGALVRHVLLRAISDRPVRQRSARHHPAPGPEQPRLFRAQADKVG
ncbi:MAG: hypothetical protein ACRD88_11935, partial [Terriglobia bacterium]